jgi:hypothetical protein
VRPGALPRIQCRRAQPDRVAARLTPPASSRAVAWDHLSRSPPAFDYSIPTAGLRKLPTDLVGHDTPHRLVVRFDCQASVEEFAAPGDAGELAGAANQLIGAVLAALARVRYKDVVTIPVCESAGA